MSCACENKRMSQEYERMRRLAKALAKMENKDVVTYSNDDGTYGFTSDLDNNDKPIVEYITPY